MTLTEDKTQTELLVHLQNEIHVNVTGKTSQGSSFNAENFVVDFIEDIRPIDQYVNKERRQ